MNKFFQVMLAVMIALPGVSYSQEELNSSLYGGHVGGGDYKSEGRIKSIRDNIYEWINAGHAKSLKFRSDLDHETYATGMKAVLDPSLGNVVVNVIKTSEENPNDEELNTLVNGVPKTCKWFISTKDERKHILCNYEKFWEHSESEQYRLIHHEYAGLAGVEKAELEDSDYFYSDQITDKLVYERVLRLPVKPEDRLTTKNFTCGFALRGGVLKFEKHDIKMKSGETLDVELKGISEYSKVEFKLIRDHSTLKSLYMMASVFDSTGKRTLILYGTDAEENNFYGGFLDIEKKIMYIAYCNVE